MQLGPYRLAAPLEPTAAGPAFRATVEDGRDVEVRYLDRVRTDLTAWTALSRRLRLVNMLDHPAHLRPLAVELDHDPPYLVLPVSDPASPPAPVYAATPLAILLAAAHRLGLTLGAAGRPILRRVGAQFFLDLTDTAGFPTGPDTTDPADDVARLADLLDGPAAGRPEDWKGKLARMRAADSAERPVADELESWFKPSDLANTVDTFDPGLTRVMPEDAQSMRPPRVGERVGRFLLTEKLGEGAMGVVFKADDPADGTAVALKVMRSSAMASDKARRRFVREGRVLAALNSPYVTRLVEANMDGDRCYLALEFVAGSSVGVKLREAKRFDEATALNFIADAARGLAAAHALGLIHRDVKPDNLLVSTADGRSTVKVTDFGLARSILPTESLELTKQGTAIGTPLYMAPEQFGSGRIDARADVYGLGATLFHFLAGRTPFEADGLAELARAVMQDAPPALEKLNPAVSGPTVAFVAKCLSKDPVARPVDAGAFLRDVERLLGGEPTELTTHPRMPAWHGPVKEVVCTWELNAPPAKLWPYVSNTERLNRAIGLPAVEYVLRPDPGRGVRRFATAKVAGMRMEWEEHPYEWIEGRRMGVLREFSRGPFAWFTSVVELEPRTGGGTALKHTVRAAPRGLLGRLAAWLEIGKKAPRSLEKVYRRIDALVTGGEPGPADDAFETPSQLPASRQARVTTGVARLVAAGAAPDAADVLGLYLANAPDQEAARIRPIVLARRFGIDESMMTDACLRAVRAGLLQLQWDIICPLCRIPSGRRDTLRDVKDHEHCPACVADFEPDFAAALELVFQAHPEIRAVEAGTFCVGGPVHSPHVAAQARVAPGEVMELQLALPAGSYRVRGPQLPWTFDLRVAPEAINRRLEVDLASSTAPRVGAFAPGGQVLALRNGRSHEVVIRVERTAGRDDALTAARATALSAFRELFPGEILSPGQLAPASAVTLIVVQVQDGDRLYDRLGEARAFQLWQAAFRAMEAVIRSEGGTVVKALGDGLVAAFTEVTPGVRAALRLAQAVAADSVAAELKVKVGLHRGLALIATVNDRLDYFGQTVRTANRLAAAAEPNEVWMSVAAAGDPEVAPLIRDRDVALTELPGGDRGSLLAYRVPNHQKGDHE
jgi:eukaryotic-like serine/threonine-protein kinase